MLAIVPVIMPITNITKPPKIAGSQPVIVKVFGIKSDIKSNARAGNIQKPKSHKGITNNRARPRVDIVHSVASVTDNASTAHRMEEKPTAKIKADKKWP
jgi:hypothetical protein